MPHLFTNASKFWVLETISSFFISVWTKKRTSILLFLKKILYLFYKGSPSMGYWNVISAPSLIWLPSSHFYASCLTSHLAKQIRLFCGFSLLLSLSFCGSSPHFSYTNNIISYKFTERALLGSQLPYWKQLCFPRKIQKDHLRMDLKICFKRSFKTVLQ